MVLAGECALLAAFAGVLLAYLIHLLLCQFVRRIHFAPRGKRQANPVAFGFNAGASDKQSGRNAGTMFPMATRKNVPNGCLVDTVLRRKIILLAHFACVTAANFFYLFKREFREKVLFSSKRVVVTFVKIGGALSVHVRSVFFGRSNFQVFGIHAASDVLSWAVVQHQESWRNRTMKQKPRADMSVQRPPLSVFEAAENLTVPMPRTSAAGPEPVSINYLNLRHEPLRERARKSLRSQIIRVSVWLHKSVSLIFATPSDANREGTFILALP